MAVKLGRPGLDGPARALLVDDSETCLQLLESALAHDPGVQVVGTARDGREALRAVESLRPDVVTMDVRMPVMDGIEATAAIMTRRPTPILVLTGHPDVRGRDATFAAISAGALDLVLKPDLGDDGALDAFGRELGRLLRYLATVDVAGVRGSSPLRGEIPCGMAAVAMAASAGGPRALHAVLRGLPRDFPVGIAVVQHIGDDFVREFAAWLDSEVELHVRVAERGDRLVPGTVLVAAPGRHLELTRSGLVRLVEPAGDATHVPSADALLASAARCFGERACGVILSGMGEDGVEGLARVHAAGGLTVAQDEVSSTVYGMPAAAVDRGVVDWVLPVQQVAAALRRACAPAADGLGAPDGQGPLAPGVGLSGAAPRSG